MPIFFYMSLEEDRMQLVFFNKKKVVFLREKEIKSDELIRVLARILNQKKWSLQAISGIIRGPVKQATFSASRGITNFVNVLAFSLDIPLAGTDRIFKEEHIALFTKLIEKSKPGKFLLPEYRGEPHITIGSNRT